MLRYIHQDPVGLPGIIALVLGLAAFLTALFLARRRGRLGPKSDNSARRGASILWIIVQGIGIGIAGFGPLNVDLDPFSVTALVEGLVVAGLMVGMVTLFDSSSRTMGRNWALVARTRADGNLVQSGPFAYVRNPIYVALFLFMLAMAIAYGHTTNLLVAIPVFVLGTMMRVWHEEAVLRAAFGTEFDAYAARVKRFVPRVF